MRLLACLIVAPQRGYDEPAILSYAISSFCPTSADGLQCCSVIFRPGLSRRASPLRPTHRLPAACGFTKSSMTASASRKTGPQVRFYSRPGNDLTRRFPLIVETLARLRSRSCIIAGEAIACDDNGVASFDLIRHLPDVNE